MGWWEHGEGGLSFVKSDNDPNNKMVWGDEPADIIDNALFRITAAFVKELGRMPSRKEIIAGIQFSTNVLDEFAEEPKDAPMANPVQWKTVEANYWTAVEGSAITRYEAVKHIREALAGLYLKNEEDGPQEG